MFIKYINGVNTNETGELVEIWGTSEETKPTNFAGGSLYNETDTGVKYEFDEKDELWNAREASTVNNQNKTITANGAYTADAGYTGLGTVTVAIPLEATKTVTANGTITPSEGKTAMQEVIVNVQPTLQEKTITVSQAVAGTEITPDEGYDGISKITIVADETEGEE